MQFSQPAQVHSPGAQEQDSPQLIAVSHRSIRKQVTTHEQPPAVFLLLGHPAQVHWPFGQEQLSPQVQLSLSAAFSLLFGHPAHVHWPAGQPHFSPQVQSLPEAFLLAQSQPDLELEGEVCVWLARV